RKACEGGTPPRPLLILAPRHPQRFDRVAELLASSGLAWQRRSRLEESGGGLAPGGVLLLDSIGELASTYQVAALAFVGGSLAPHGGHNLLEPAYWGVAAAIAEQFLAAGAALRVGSAHELGHVWRRMLADEGARQHIGAAARALLASQRGATERALDAIAAVLEKRAAAGY